MRIGYLVPEFPSQTHAFFWRELSALREMGHTVTLLSTRRPPHEACRHAFAEEARAETRYLFPPDVREALRWTFQHAFGAARVGTYVAGLSESPPGRKARVAALAACAAMLCRIAERERLDHVHGHSCADAAHLLALARALGGPSYSLTLHGDLPVYGKDHASKMRGAAFVSAVTRPLQHQIVERVGLPPERVPVIWMTIPSAFAPTRADVGRRAERCTS